MKVSSSENDRRIVRTRMRLDDAFVQLLHRRCYGDIRVSGICRKAGVGRATFYSHYSSKDDLLRSQFRRIVSPMLTRNKSASFPVDATPLFAHVRSAPRLYQALMGKAGAARAPRILRDCFEERLRQLLDLSGAGLRGEPSLAMSDAMIVRFVASSLLAILECWAENNSADSPQKLQAFFARLVGSGLGAL